MRLLETSDGLEPIGIVEIDIFIFFFQYDVRQQLRGDRTVDHTIAAKAGGDQYSSRLTRHMTDIGKAVDRIEIL